MSQDGKVQYRIAKDDVEAFSEKSRVARERIHDMLLGLDVTPDPAMHKAGTILMLMMSPSPEEQSLYRFLLWKLEQEHDLSDTEVAAAQHELRNKLNNALKERLNEEDSE